MFGNIIPETGWPRKSGAITQPSLITASCCAGVEVPRAAGGNIIQHLPTVNQVGGRCPPPNAGAVPDDLDHLGSETVFASHESLPWAERYDRARAAATYRLNMQITESLVVMFHVLEVVLRNAVHHEMKYSARREDWYEEWRDQPRLADLYGYIEAARAKLRKRKEKATPDKIVAELSFGFWTTLFNKKYMALTSKALMRVFRRCPNRLRQPGLIGARLNKTRELRNRSFHHEPIIWSAAQEIHAQDCQLIHWISADLAD